MVIYQNVQLYLAESHNERKANPGCCSFRVIIAVVKGTESNCLKIRGKDWMLADFDESLQTVYVD